MILINTDKGRVAGSKRALRAAQVAGVVREAAGAQPPGSVVASRR